MNKNIQNLELTFRWCLKIKKNKRKTHGAHYKFSSSSIRLVFVESVTDNEFKYKSVYLLAADHLVAVVLLGQHTQRGLDDSSPQTEHQVEGRLCKGNKRGLVTLRSQSCQVINMENHKVNSKSGIFLENNFKYQNAYNNEFGGAISAIYVGFFTISCFLFDIFRGGMAP